MTAENFVTEAQAYYGHYNPTQRKYVLQWLQKRSDKAIGFIFAECLKTVEAKYKQPPCIADLERCYKEVRERKPALMAKPAVPLLEEDAMPKEDVSELLKETLSKLVRKGRYNKPIDKNVDMV